MEYDGNMDKECVALCDTLNSLPKTKTFESCCGHLVNKFSIWFFCISIDTLSRLARSTSCNYSDGKWEIIADSTDTSPRGVFWLRSTEVFKSTKEMEESVNNLISNIKYWFKEDFDEYFSKNEYRQSQLHCSDCTHCKSGKLSMRNQWWESFYCDKKPKTIRGEEKYFYAVNPKKKACEEFEK